LRKGTQNITRALVLFVLAGIGPNLGCVNLTPPWERDGYAADARKDVTDVKGKDSPREAEDAFPIDPDAADDADRLAPEPPVDTGLPSPRDGGGPADTSPDASSIGLVDTFPDTSKADATTDAPQPPVDSSNDSPVTDLKVEVSDAPMKADHNPDQTIPMLDSSLADTALDASPPTLDTGREAPAISGLLASYPCEMANGASLPDTSGNGKHATLANASGGTPVGFSFVSGKVGNALALRSSDKAYVSLPRGIVAQQSQVTIATWVKLNSSAAFQRIFDFGVDTDAFMYLANSAGGGGVRFRIASVSLGKNQVVEGPTALPVGSWTHVALTLGDNGVSIFLDGAQVAQQAPAVLRPSDLGDTGNNFIGRSPFTADPYLDGQIDEFRIYDRVLTAAEIGELASGR